MKMIEDRFKKQNENYYHRYLNKYIKQRLNPMTLIIGARCKDGVVLVGDRKVSGGLRPKFTNKIRVAPPFNDVVYAAAGTETLFEEFIDQMPKNVLWKHTAVKERNKDVPESLQIPYTLRDFKHDCVSLLKEMKGVYSEIPHEECLQILVATQDHELKKSTLYFLDMQSCFPGEVKELLPIGMGHLTMPFLGSWKPEMTMRASARLFSFIIKFIDKEDISNGTIGLGKTEPQIWLVPDDGDVREIQGEETKELLKGIDKRVEKVRREIGSRCSFFLG